ncbi:MAG: helix-turn-helix transcriptional regulator [Victivallales bacterium]|nr:helix-turn-helix transcriptional regulator [Victivallales bacterium]
MNYFDGLDFLGFGNVERHAACHTAQVFDGYYGIQYNHRGRLNFGVGGGSLASFDGAWAFITHPDEVFHYGPPFGEKRHHVYVCFKGPRVDEFIRRGLISVGKAPQLMKITRSDRFFATMLELHEQLRKTPAHRDRAVLLLEDLLLQIHEQPSGASVLSSHLKSALSRLVEEIEASPYLEWNFKKEASALGLSYSHFRRIFKSLFEIPPGRLVIDTRLRMAAERLLRGDEQISVVAESCGFEDVFYFSRIFKKYHHLSPLAYRREFGLFSDEPIAKV